MNYTNQQIKNMCNAATYRGEIEIAKKYVTLYQLSNRQYILMVEGDMIIKCSSRKEVDKYLSEM